MSFKYVKKLGFHNFQSFPASFSVFAAFTKNTKDFQKMMQENSENWGNQVFYIFEWHIFWRECFNAFHAKWNTLLDM